MAVYPALYVGWALFGETAGRRLMVAVMFVALVSLWLLVVCSGAALVESRRSRRR
jgi:hypothetical protein